MTNDPDKNALEGNSEQSERARRVAQRMGVVCEHLIAGSVVCGEPLEQESGCRYHGHGGRKLEGADRRRRLIRVAERLGVFCGQVLATDALGYVVSECRRPPLPGRQRCVMHKGDPYWYDRNRHEWVRMESR